MIEIVPIVGGLLVGLALHLIPPRARAWAGTLAAFGVGALVTVASGEYLIGWEYLLFDIPLACLSMVAGYLSARHLAPSRARRRRNAGM